MKIKSPETEKEFKGYYHLRWKLLRKPWNQPEGSEKDDKEEEAIHIIVLNDDGEIVGVGRGHFNSEDEAQIRYMAVEEADQGKGIGALILDALEAIIKEKNPEKIILNARDKAMGFYKKHGYLVVKEAHVLFDQIPHYRMEKNVKRLT